MDQNKHDINPIEFGKVLARLDAQDQHISDLKSGQESANRKLDVLLEFQARQKGAASVLLMLSTAVAAFVGWAVSYFTR